MSLTTRELHDAWAPGVAVQQVQFLLDLCFSVNNKIHRRILLVFTCGLCAQGRTQTLHVSIFVFVLTT